MCCKTTVDVHWVFPNNSLPSFSVYGDFSVKNLFIKVFVTILSRKKMTQFLGLSFLYCIKPEGRGHRMCGPVSMISMLL